MREAISTIIALGVSAALAVPALAGGGSGGGNAFRTSLNGYEEVPAVSTDASGRFRITVFRNQADYRLVYDGIRSAVQFAHIHFGREFTNGGVIVFLCDNTGAENAPEDTPACPPNGQVVTGTLTEEDVVGPVAQGIGSGEFREFLRAMRRGATYVNVHSDDFPGGEIRGQIRRPARPSARR